MTVANEILNNLTGNSPLDVSTAEYNEAVANAINEKAATENNPNQSNNTMKNLIIGFVIFVALILILAMIFKKKG